MIARKDYEGFPPLPYYDIQHSVGYPGRRAEASSLNQATLTRLYVLEAGKSFIPVVAVSPNPQILDTMEHIANVFIGSVRLAPLEAQSLKTTITLADPLGHWNHGPAAQAAFLACASYDMISYHTIALSDAACLTFVLLAFMFMGKKSPRRAPSWVLPRPPRWRSAPGMRRRICPRGFRRDPPVGKESLREAPTRCGPLRLGQLFPDDFVDAA